MLSKICYFTYWLLSTIIVDRSFRIAMVSLFWLSYACSLCESPWGAATPILHYNGKASHTCSKRAKVHRFCSLIQSYPSHTLTSSWQTVLWIWNHVYTHICSVKFVWIADLYMVCMTSSNHALTARLWKKNHVKLRLMTFIAVNSTQWQPNRDLQIW